MLFSHHGPGGRLFAGWSSMYHGRQSRCGGLDSRRGGGVLAQGKGAVGPVLGHHPPPHPLKDLLVAGAGQMILFHRQSLLMIWIHLILCE